MAITHSLVSTDWTIDSATGNIRYIGHDHNGASPSYATVIEFHRWLQSLADDQSPAEVDDEMDITNTNPSQRSTDNIITLINGYNIDDGAAEHLYDGSIIQDGGDTIYDGIVNFGNASVQIQIQQDGAVISDDYWNYNIGAAASGGSGTTLIDTGIGWTTNEWTGYTVRNTTDNCYGIALSNTTDTITFASGQLHGGTNDDFEAADTYLIGQPLNPNVAQGVSHRFMIKTRADGVDIDGRRLIGICRRFGNTYSEFKINGTSRGNNVLALNDTADLNNTTAPATVLGTTWDTDFSNTGGLRAIDVNGDGTDEEYYSEWTWSGTHTINDLFERIKGEQEDLRTTAVDSHGLAGNIFRGINYSFGYDTETGGISVSTNDMLVWGTLLAYDTRTVAEFSVGEAIIEDTATPQWKARVLAVDDSGVTGTLVVAVESGTVETGDDFTGQTSGGKANTNGTPTPVSGGGVLHILANDSTDDILYAQVIKGTMAADDGVLYYGGTDLTDGGTVDVTDFLAVDNAGAAITERTISNPAAGVSTGTAIIGSYGLGIASAKLSASDKVFDLTNTQITPPNTVTNTVSGLESGEDYVLVAPWDGSSTDVNGDPAIDTDQMSINATYNGAGVTTISVNDIPPSTPDSGTIRLVNDEGFHIRIAYSSYDDGTDDFTVTSTNFSGSGLTDSATSGNDCYVTYIDKLATAGSENFQAVYDSGLNLVVVVRDGASTPIKQFISSWSFGSSDGSISAIRTTDA